MGGGQEQTIETFVEDHKGVKGVQYPRAVTTRHDGKHYLRQAVADIRFEDLGDMEFGKP